MPKPPSEAQFEAALDNAERIDVAVELRGLEQEWEGSLPKDIAARVTKVRQLLADGAHLTEIASHMRTLYEVMRRSLTRLAYVKPAKKSAAVRKATAQNEDVQRLASYDKYIAQGELPDAAVGLAAEECRCDVTTIRKARRNRRA